MAEAVNLIALIGMLADSRANYCKHPGLRLRITQSTAAIIRWHSSFCLDGRMLQLGSHAAVPSISSVGRRRRFRLRCTRSGWCVGRTSLKMSAPGPPR